MWFMFIFLNNWIILIRFWFYNLFNLQKNKANKMVWKYEIYTHKLFQLPTCSFHLQEKNVLGTNIYIRTKTRYIYTYITQCLPLNYVLLIFGECTFLDKKISMFLSLNYLSWIPIDPSYILGLYKLFKQQKH